MWEDTYHGVLRGGRTHGWIGELPRKLNRVFRPRVVVNTYAEWGPTEWVPGKWPTSAEWPWGVPIGVDESLVISD